MSLTKYPTASLKELWYLAYPLMIQTLSVLAMLFVDRLILTQYSIDAFNASINASTTSFAFLIFLMTVGGIAGVFVSQYNGYGLKEKFGEPVWQMVWFGLFSTVIFIPLAFYFPDFIWSSDRFLEKQYFRWVILFAPFYAIYAALASFFIGQGHTKFVSYLSAFSNLVNIFLDFILIFGVEGVIPSLGIAGAAISTSVSQVFQVIVLAALFLTKERRQTFGTGNWRFSFKPFKECLNIGIPGATAYTLEILCWAFYFELATRKGPSFITAVGIFQTFTLILIFFQDGIMRATEVIVGFLIGSQKLEFIPKLIKNGLILLLLFSLVQYILYVLLGHQMIDLFLKDNHTLHEILHQSLIILIIYLFIDGVRYLFTGLLTGAGDTVFLLVAGVLTNIFLLVLPQYIAMTYFDITILQSISLTIACVFFGALILFIRYQRGHWKKLDLSNRSF